MSVYALSAKVLMVKNPGKIQNDPRYRKNPDRRQNLTVSSLGHAPPVYKITSKFITFRDILFTRNDCTHTSRAHTARAQLIATASLYRQIKS